MYMYFFCAINQYGEQYLVKKNTAIPELIEQLIGMTLKNRTDKIMRNEFGIEPGSFLITY